VDLRVLESTFLCPQRANAFPDVLVLVLGLVGSGLRGDNGDVCAPSEDAVAHFVLPMKSRKSRLSSHS
jgi:hypothetical protein